MSQEDLDVVRIAHERFSAGDVEGFVSLLHPDVEFVSLVMEADGVRYRGHEGARDYIASMHSTFGAFRSEIVEMRQVEDTVILDVRVEGEGLLSKLSIGQGMWQAAKLRDGKVSWAQFCRTEAEALEAAGLPRQASGRDGHRQRIRG